MVKVVVVNGRPECGKTTFETKCKELVAASSTFWYDEEQRMAVDVISTVDFVKQIAKECGWDGIKTPRNRKFLSDLKDLLTEWNDVPFQKVLDHVMYLDIFAKGFDWLLFVDCREPAEIQKLKERLNATTLLIRRPGDDEAETSNHADAGVFNYEYDLTIENNSDIMDLEDEARKFIEYMKKEEVPYYVNK